MRCCDPDGITRSPARSLIHLSRSSHIRCISASSGVRVELGSATVTAGTLLWTPPQFPSELGKIPTWSRYRRPILEGGTDGPSKSSTPYGAICTGIYWVKSTFPNRTVVTPGRSCRTDGITSMQLS